MDQRGDRRHVFSAPEPINLRGAIEFRLDQTLCCGPIYVCPKSHRIGRPQGPFFGRPNFREPYIVRVSSMSFFAEGLRTLLVRILWGESCRRLSSWYSRALYLILESSIYFSFRLAIIRRLAYLPVCITPASSWRNERALSKLKNVQFKICLFSLLDGLRRWSSCIVICIGGWTRQTWFPVGPWSSNVSRRSRMYACPLCSDLSELMCS